MAKSTHNDVIDAMLNYIKDNATRMVACSTEPTTYTEANATYALADVTIADTDFTIGDGDVSGRKATVAAKNSVPIDTSGTFAHVALLDVANTKLLYVTTGTNQPLVGGGTADFPAWDIEIADPS